MRRYIYPLLGPVKRRIVNAFSNPSLILIYHRVTTLQRDPQLLAVSPENFEAQVRVLKKDYSLLTPEEYVHFLNDYKRMPRKSILITFDDGYADNYLEARPILESNNANAIFYITTSKIGTTEKLWWDELEEIVFDGSPRGTLEFNAHGVVNRFEVHSDTQRREVYTRLHPLIKNNNVAARESLMRQLRHWGNVHNPDLQAHRLLTVDELRSFSGSPACTIGAHTVDHPMLSQLDYQAQFDQIIQSRTYLEKTCGMTVKHFSYPFGIKMHDYNTDSVRACKNIGFDMVSANYYGQAHSWTSRFEMPRVLIRDWDGPTFSTYMRDFFRS
jgi:peptidoglycan/xylan/chitin deacetylase (PgdA/CDA1 family)